MSETEKREVGRWLEEYEHCSHTFVAKRKEDLRGYCARCGTDRKRIYHLPEAVEVGDER